MLYVTKADGSKQPFRREKIVRTCLRMHVTQSVADEVANKVAARAYDGIPTKKILRMIFNYMKKYKPEVGYEIDLRKAISLLRPKPDFEKFVAKLLQAYGYKVLSNRIVAGKCIEHEIDAIATKGKDTLYVEVKHHKQPHTYTGLGVFLESQATFEDLVEGYKAGATKIKFNKAFIVCNTKISDHAKRYAACKDMLHMGWKAPADRGLEQMVEEKRLYPITFLKNLDGKSEAKIADAGIILLKELVKCDADKLHRKTKIAKGKLKDLMDEARKILSS